MGYARCSRLEVFDNNTALRLPTGRLIIENTKGRAEERLRTRVIFIGIVDRLVNRR